VRAKEKCARRSKNGLGNLAEGSHESFLPLSGCRLTGPSYSSRRSIFLLKAIFHPTC